VADILSTSLEIVVKQEKSFFTKVELGHVSLHLSNVDLDKPAVNWYVEILTLLSCLLLLSMSVLVIYLNKFGPLE